MKKLLPILLFILILMPAQVAHADGKRYSIIDGYYLSKLGNGFATFTVGETCPVCHIGTLEGFFHASSAIHGIRCNNGGCSAYMVRDCTGEATCTQSGTCTVCGNTYYDCHDYRVCYPRDATCTEIGYKYQCWYCTKCKLYYDAGSKLVTDAVIPAGHDIVPHEAKAPTCTEPGWGAYDTCSRCDYTTYAEKPATGHTEVVDSAVKPTCTTSGKTEGKHCSVCNKVLTAQKEVPAKGHTEVVDAAIKSTCTAPGKTEGKHCSVCNKVLVAQKEVPAKGHTEVIDAAVVATCTTSSKTEGKHCSVCNKVLTAQKDIPAKGHSWGEWKTTKEPTETTKGEKQRVCKNDSSHVEKESIPVKEKEPEKIVSGVPMARMTAKGKKKLKISWVKVDGADGYDIFFAECGRNEKAAYKNVNTITGNTTFTWTKTGLKAKNAYKAYVKAFVMRNGSKKYVGTSPAVHAFTSGYTKKYTNAKSVKVKKTKVSVGTGKTYKIKASVKKLKKKLKLMPKKHAASLRYLSTDPSIATVSKKGKIKGIKAGTCYVYVFAHNGVLKKITVTVG